MARKALMKRPTVFGTVRDAGHPLMRNSSFFRARKCHHCAAEMGGMQWLCPSCRSQNRRYTALQMIVSMVLAFVVLFFMAER
jgi:uncharacterized paraquat-inducible protein A